MVELLVTYMEMTAPPSYAAKPAPAVGLTVGPERIGRADYLALYREVGETLDWDQRLRMRLTELDALLAESSTQVHVLRHDGRAVGMCEFARVGGPEVELVHFGLVPDAYGQGFGGFLLDGALRACWTRAPRRIWLHTDTNDHPRALSFYEKMGFRSYQRRMETFPD
ncbi:GNAT family N-acetyltransferase [Aquamicrobium sp. LC103]|uniref:GNAT family N-acetyltransferase n=1 Tax=Aquamicrobium sp. LC103 TaxID=1120658 RepID=UPI00063E90B5|nr:GNAT family N-acetyltransferase [Aquamicrobium sp. LC103]TKT82656.1 GNAT family N-acetyltransferase [Aquamicrobium sp. LC103]